MSDTEVVFSDEIAVTKATRSAIMRETQIPEVQWSQFRVRVFVEPRKVMPTLLPVPDIVKARAKRKMK